ncbi:MAG: hypothetical protein HY791_05805 [Deltaproteobacteria bacterium]|nr:hypothetical protein [Deltaproteobacteria bacterium]
MRRTIALVTTLFTSAAPTQVFAGETVTLASDVTQSPDPRFSGRASVDWDRGPLYGASARLKLVGPAGLEVGGYVRQNMKEGSAFLGASVSILRSELWTVNGRAAVSFATFGGLESPGVQAGIDLAYGRTHRLVAAIDATMSLDEVWYGYGYGSQVGLVGAQVLARVGVDSQVSGTFRLGAGLGMRVSEVASVSSSTRPTLFLCASF